MSQKRHWHRLNPFAQHRTRPPLDDIWSAQQFRTVLRRALGHAHHRGHAFSLVVLDSTSSETTEHLKSVLCRWMRSNSDAGWLDGQRIGIILPDTSVKGAWKVADDICQKVNGNGPQPSCKVYYLEGP